MTNQKKTFNALNFDRFFVGTDLLAKNAQWLTNMGSYPPYNILKIDNTYVIEMAVAGFTSKDIEITLEDNKLFIKGDAPAQTRNVGEYLYTGIANRAFTRQFALADNVVIDSAELVDGMLRISLQRIIPESSKPRKIEIIDTPKKAKE